ncbi:UNVERIFIED_CONTAM: methionine/alanine import family NSS transporter small subunit [Staphylococcus haemolyticus]
MNTSALIMMIFSMVLLWGGLALAVMHLAKNPDEPED